MKLLITSRGDNNFTDYSEITHPIFKKYAKKVGADFLQLDHEPPSDSGDGRPHYRIFKHKELHETYDRILHLDSDALMLPSFPNIFKTVPYEKIGTIYEDKGSRRFIRRETLFSAQNKFGWVNLREGYFNTGCFLTSKIHKDIFSPVDGHYWQGFGSDDVLLAYNTKKLGFEVHELSYKFNHTTMFSEPWNDEADRFKSHLIHYAGRGIFDSEVANRLAQIKADYKKVYPDGI